jgi:hypothetical protein
LKAILLFGTVNPKLRRGLQNRITPKRKPLRGLVSQCVWKVG